MAFFFLINVTPNAKQRAPVAKTPLWNTRTSMSKNTRKEKRKQHTLGDEQEIVRVEGWNSSNESAEGKHDINLKLVTTTWE
jgi:hypothetical protein